MEPQLRLLEEDILLERDGGEILYVIDFAAIFSYIWKRPYRSTASSLNRSSQEDAHEYARQQVALSFLFGGTFQNLLLIPPYRTELENHLQAVLLNAQRATYDWSRIRKMRELVEESPQFINYLKATTVDKGENKALRNTVVDLGRAYFQEMYTVILWESLDVGVTLQQLFDKKILKHANSVIPSLEDFTRDSAAESVDRWEAEIGRRRSKDRVFQTYTDALACAYLEKANQRPGTQQLTVFVSQSKNVITPLRDYPYFTSPINGLPFKIVRDLDYFWVRSVHRDRDLSRIRQDVRLSNTVARSYELLAASQESADDQTRQVIHKSESLWGEAENLLLLSNMSIDDLPDSRERANDEFVSWLMNLYGSEEKPGLKAKAMDLLAKIAKDLLQIGRKWPAGPHFHELQIHVTQDIDRALVRLAVLPDELPITFELVGEDPITLAGKFEAALFPSDKLEIRENILDVALRGNSCGFNVLSACMFAADERYDAAARELDSGLKIANCMEKKELWFLSALFHRKMFLAKPALDAISEALEYDPDDPRFHLECGKIHWLKWYQQREESTTTRVDSDDDLATAIHHLEDALIKVDNAHSTKDLRIQCEHTLAFVYCEKSLLKEQAVDEHDREIAEAHFAKVVELLPMEEWPGRFRDSWAWLLYARALSLGTENVDEKRMWLTEAQKSANRALETQGAVTARRFLLKQHLAHIKRALEGLPSQ
jgi:hypothetical protein